MELARQRKSLPPSSLRARAEAVSRRGLREVHRLSATEAQRLVHELEVHQIELEMQNEELRQAQAELASSRDRLTELYDFAPVCYVTLDARGTVLEANLTTARMLGVARNDLLDKKLSRFVTRDSQDALYLHCHETMADGRKHACELLLRRADGASFPARLESVSFEGGSQTLRCHTAIIDMTAVRQAEALMRQSEAQYRLLFELNPNPMWIFDEATLQFLAVNEAAVKLYGWSREQFLRMTVREIRPPEEVPKLAEKLSRLRSSRAAFVEEWRHWKEDHTLLDVEVTISCLQFQGRNAYLAMINDVTERNRAEEALRASEQRLSVAASGTRIGMYEWNIATGETLWTEQHACLLGLAKTTRPTATLSLKYHYRDWARRVHRDDLPRVEAAMRRCVAQRVPVEVEYRVVWPDQSVHWVSGRGVCMYDALGKPERMLGIIMDITNRKQAEAQLQELNATLERRVAQRTERLTRAHELLQANEQALADFFVEAPLGLLWVAPGGRILRVNAAFAAMLGYHPDELFGRQLAEFGADPEIVLAIILGLARKEPMHDRLVRLRRNDLSLLHVLIDVNGLWEKGKLIRSRWFVRDMTHRVELQKEILAIGERVERRLGQDLHDDLCQQLTSIEFLSRALERQLAANSRPEAARALEIAQVTRQALTYTRKLSHTVAPMELETEGLAEALKTLAAGTRRVFHVDCQFRVASAIAVDDHVARIYLYRIAQEAINNAVKHGKAKRIRISLKAKGNRIILSVRDDGVGLPSKPAKPKGFGLRIMDYRASALGGALVVEKRKGGGTALICSIPSTQDRTPGRGHP